MKKLTNTEIIEKYIKDNNLTKTKFCKLCDISPSTYKKIISNGNVRIDAIFKIASFLKIEVHHLFNMNN